MPYKINGIVCSANLTRRRTSDNWFVSAEPTDNYPFLDRTGQGATNATVTVLFNSSYINSIPALKERISGSEKLYLRSNTAPGKYLYGSQKYLWISPASINFNGIGDNVVTAEIGGSVDFNQIHTCDFTDEWTATGTMTTSPNRIEGKSSIRHTISGSGTEQQLIFPLDTTACGGQGYRDLTRFSRLTFWIYSPTAYTTFTTVDALLRTGASSYFRWFIPYNTGTWTFIDLDLYSPSGSAGTPLLTQIVDFSLRVRLPATSSTYYHEIDNIRLF